MPPKSQRSRACNQCRERRVKCDETPELCQQCRRLGLTCSGPIQGSVIIDMTDRVAKPRQRKKREPKPTPAIRQPVERVAAIIEATPTAKADASDQLTNGSASRRQLTVGPGADQKLVPRQRSPREADEAFTAMRDAYRMPQLYQPSRMQAQALDLAFISHFVQLNKATRAYSPEVPWITHFPTLHDRSLKPALKLSIRAASMAFYATMHRDPTILVDSYRWYTVSLHSQRLSIERLGAGEMPMDDEILVPIILSLYEVYAGTTSTSVFHHLAAATKLLEMRGPGRCRSGIAWPLFKAMRVSDGHKAIMLNRPSVFSNPEWMTIPLVDQARNAHQYLADVMLAIPACIDLCKTPGSLRAFFAAPLPRTLDRCPIKARALRLLQDIDNWANRHPTLTTVTPNPVYVPADPTSLATSGVITTPGSSLVLIPSSYIAFTAANYESLRLILYRLLDKLGSEPDAPEPALASTSSPKSPFGPSTPPYSSIPPLVDNAIVSSKAILDAAAYLEATHPVGFDFMRSIFPLVVVAIVSPRQEERSAARGMVDRWGKSRGMAGLCNAWFKL